MAKRQNLKTYQQFIEAGKDHYSALVLSQPDRTIHDRRDFLRGWFGREYPHLCERGSKRLDLAISIQTLIEYEMGDADELKKALHDVLKMPPKKSGGVADFRQKDTPEPREPDPPQKKEPLANEVRKTDASAVNDAKKLIDMQRDPRDIQPLELNKLIQAIPPDRKSERRHDNEWAYAHLLVPLSQIEASEVPSREALTVLVWAKNDGWGKFLEAQMRVQLAAEEAKNRSRWTDHGEDIDDLLRELEDEQYGNQWTTDRSGTAGPDLALADALRSLGPDQPSEEPEVPAQSDATGSE